MKILYVSLLPEKNNCNEIENLIYFQNSSKYYEINDLFSYRLFSCHDEMVELVKTVFECEHHSMDNLFNFVDFPMIIEKLNFEYLENMDERRAHEIAWSKQKIFLYMTLKPIVDNFDYIFYNDADIKIDANDVYELCKVLESKEENTFINIPYVIKIKKQVVSDSFGSFIITPKIVSDSASILHSLYQQIEEDDRIYRKDAPDWILRQLLIKQGYKEIRGESCNTKHYIDNHKYYEFDSTKITFN